MDHEKFRDQWLEKVKTAKSEQKYINVKWRWIIELIETHWNIIHAQLLHRTIFCLFSLLNHSSICILLHLHHFARPASRKTKLLKNYLFTLSALRNTPVFGDSHVNFTTKLTAVNFPSPGCHSYLTTQLKVFMGRVCLRSKRFFLSAVFSNKFFCLKQAL